MNIRMTPNLLRRLVQAGFALVCLFIGYRFALFLRFASGTGPEAARPASVEAFLPISALMAAKRFLLTWQWDAVHPAGLALFFCFVLMAWLLRKSFCGHVCPVGFLSTLLQRAGEKTGLACRTQLPKAVSIGLLIPKYLLLGFFLYSILSMPLAGLSGFLRSPYNLTADARLFAFFASPGGVAIAVIGLLVLLSLIFKNPWCRFLCPYGALLGLASFFSPLGIGREVESCIGCRKCTKTCPGGIAVHEKTSVTSPECVGCTACVSACPVPGCLSVRAGGLRLPSWVLPLGAVALVVLCFALAQAFGVWETAMPGDMLLKLYSRTLP